MRLLRLELQTLPGVEPGFALEDLAPGVNLVTGPNGVGKSSLLRALIHLIGGAASGDPPALALTAVFANDARWTVRRTGSQVSWERDGQPSDPPPLPARDELRCYWLSMEDLLSADERDAHFLAELQRALAGGYDLKALREGPFQVRPRIGMNEARTLQAARQALRDVERDYEALRREEAELPELERRIAAARRAAEREQRLDQALALLEARRERGEVEAVLARFPPEMARLRGDEPQRLDALERKREKLAGDLEAQRRRREEQHDRLTETGLERAKPTAEELAARRAELEALRTRRELLGQARKDLEKAQAGRAQALALLGAPPDDQSAPPRLDPESITQSEKLAIRLTSRQAERDELMARMDESGEAPQETELVRDRQAAEALRAWLATGAGRSWRLRVAVALAGLGALLAAVSGAWTGAWGALLGGGWAFAAALWAAWEARGERAGSARRRFEDSGREPPPAWQRDAVSTRLEEIEQRLAGLRQAQARAQEAAAHRRRLERVERELVELESQKHALAARLGFDPMLTAVGLDHFVRRVNEYHNASVECRSAESAVARLEGELAELTGTIHAFLRRWQGEPETTVEALGAALSELEARRKQAEAAERNIAEAEAAITRLENDSALIEDEIAGLFRDADLEPGQRTELEQRCARLEAWREQRDRLLRAQLRETEHGKALQDDTSLLERAEPGERAALEEERARAAEQAQKLEELQEKRSRIRTLLDEAGKDGKLERALAAVDDARTALQDRREEVLCAEAGLSLLDRVEREFRSEQEPQVLRDARERFRRFTHHGWDLELDDAEGFMARDLRQQARRSLSELSSATRMQLLLALRLAWTRRLERGGTALPLFLDEALTTSDEARFCSVARSLAQLAREEARQVFYLSARRHERELWERCTGERPHHIDLARLRFGAESVGVDDFALPAQEALPPPEGHSPESYAVALGVPPLDPRGPAGGMHLFFLLRDELGLLHRLMEDWNVATLGQLETLLASNAAAPAIPEPAMRQRLAGRCAAARAWCAAWCHGRGERVDRIALERSGAVTERFIDELSALADTLEGDGVALIEALRANRVARFRAASIEELERWLECEGYIDPRTPLDEDGRQRRTLMEAAGEASPGEIGKVVRWLEAGCAA